MRPAAAPRVFIGFTDPRSLRTEAPRLTAARCCGGWIVAARKGQPEIAHNAQPAARRLAGAADFFRNIGDRNLPDQEAVGKPTPGPASLWPIGWRDPNAEGPLSLQCPGRGPGRGPGKRLVWTFGNPRIIPTRTFSTAGVSMADAPPPMGGGESRFLILWPPAGESRVSH